MQGDPADRSRIESLFVGLIVGLLGPFGYERHLLLHLAGEPWPARFCSTTFSSIRGCRSIS